MEKELERAAKALPLVLGVLYVLGFLVVGVYLVAFGASSLELLKVQYLAAGFWCVIPLVVFWGLVAFARMTMPLTGPGFESPDPASRVKRILKREVFYDFVAVIIVLNALWLFEWPPFRFGTWADRGWVLILAAYRAPNENCVRVAVTFLGCFQTDNIHEVIQGLKHRGISLVEGGDLFSGNGLVRGKGLQDAGCQWGINLFIKFQENQADLITVREEPVAAGMSDLFD